MQFTKLRLLGFKSFVDPTELLIADGLTGVVGPNGCGKSNLLEALRWVMGENRPTAMRGSGMEDVIFAGASSRPARNYAEVTLTLDNTQRLAPAGFNDSDRIEIVRRITRDAGSAFKVNGGDSRARDVQMLFADASTGSHSPALVRQGQISELINAKPKARRRILEEAAGISGLYQRRHEAELKLRATASNLERVEDVLTQLEQRIGVLARQVRQAARYREIAHELRQTEALLLYRRWREADAALLVAEATLTEATAKAAREQGEAARCVQVRQTAADALPALREEEAIAGAVLQRLTVERDTLKDREHRARRAVERLQANIAQLHKDMDREGQLNHDAGETVARLQAEQATLIQAGAGHEALSAKALSEATQAEAELKAHEATLDQQAEDAARLSARHQTVARQLDEAQKRQAQAIAARDKSTAATTQITTDLAALRTRLADAISAQQAAQQQATVAEENLLDVEKTRAAAQIAEAEARGAASTAAGEAKALEGEVTALRRLLARDVGQGGQVLEHIRAQRGYEAALGAALGDDLKAPIAGEQGSGWSDLPPYAQITELPEGAARLADYVTAPSVLARRLQAIGVVGASEGNALQGALTPGQRLVSREGDLWRWDGYRVAAADVPSTTALRLQQKNRLEELETAHGTAQEIARMTGVAHQQAKNALEQAAQQDSVARAARRDADAAATNATRVLGRVEADMSMLQARVETLHQAAEHRAEDVVQAEEALADAQAQHSGLGDLQQVRAAVEVVRDTVAEARSTMMAARSRADAVRREGEARVKRQQELTVEINGWKQRLETAEKRTAELHTRAEDAEAELKSASSQPEQIAAKRAELSTEFTRAETRRRASSDALAVGEAALRDADQAERKAEKAASNAREGRARDEALRDAAAATVALAVERIEEALSVSPQKLLETLEADPDKMPPVDMIEADITRLRRQRDALGAVNLRAEEDSREVREEHDTLATEKADLDVACEKLRIGIANLNREGRERLLAAFDTVNENFARLFTHLFGGGEANLELIESDDPLEAGLEIMCQPPGKKLSTLSLLSGGEQTLTAMSLIFAVFLANPSPICVLDEVDAPLDDANVSRFCDLLDEMTRTTATRFLIITHHAVTMSRMDRLFGVTMAEQGVSQLVSVDLRRAEELVG
ncbi:condensin subunit Smc [Monaibacterium marinum]|uniref:Chromosome partition protein Smc n=1 Tax=Pontivivens marinum TaxID=1690039 RepID=A0A2C9CTW9_9RHOB|nr:chromosome segregation protein SMC [Monaibacterium marinum]SOH94678.1 condensin subunit Smc [Monaibacterium marinum]